MKVDIAIVGFQKAGTTSILKYLGSHPEIQTHPQKEMTFFSIKEEYSKGENVAWERYFSKEGDYKMTLIKHATLIRIEENIVRLFKHNPDCKIIVCTRNPVERAYSSYLMEVSEGNNLGGFSTVIREGFENHNNGISDWRYNVFIKLGEYANYIELLLKYFNKKNIYLIRIEDFRQNAVANTNKICDWLGVAHLPNTLEERSHNTFKGRRKGILPNVLTFLLKEGNFLKKIGKNIIPDKMHYLFGERLRELNKVNQDKIPMEENTRIFLEGHYEKHNQRLEKIIKDIG